MWIFKDYRILTEHEHINLLKIRNEKEIRAVSLFSKEILLDEHLKWVSSLKDYYFALFIDEKIVGGLYFKADKNVVKEWGLFFSKETNPLISILSTYIFIEYMFKKFDKLYSEVLVNNSQALKFNEMFGIKVYYKDEKSYKLSISKQQWEKKDLKFIKNRVSNIKYKFMENK